MTAKTTPAPPRWVLAVALALVLATAVRYGLEPVLRGDSPYAVYILATLLVGSRYGLRATLTSTALGLAVATYLFVPVRNSFRFDSRREVAGFFVALITSVLISFVTSALHRARQHAAEAQGAVADVLETVSEGFAVLDRDYRHLFVNSAAARIAGKRPEELLWRTVFEVFPELRGGEWHRAFDEAVRSREPVHLEFHFAPRDRWIETTFHPGLGGVTAVAADVTERRRAEAAYHRQLVELEALYETAPVGLALVDRQMRFLRVNARLAEMNGVPADRTLGRPLRDVVPDLGSRLEPVYRRVLETGEPLLNLEIHGRVAREPAAERTWLTSYHPLAMGGEVLGVQCVVLDITEQNRAEEALRASEEFNRKIVESSPDCIKVLTLEGRLLSISPGGMRLLEVSDFATLAGTDWLDCWRGADREAAEQALRAAVQGGVGKFRGYCPSLRGRPLYWDVVISAIHGASGRPERLLAVERDVSERVEIERERAALMEGERRARRHAEEASRMKDEFLATLSHELRTPLNAISGWSFLARSGGGPEEVRKGLDVIERNTKALARLVDDLLDASQMISGSMQLALEPTDLAVVVAEAVEAIRPAAQAKGLRMAARLGAAVVGADPGRLRQIAWNLLSNAVKFTGAGGVMEVSVERAGRRARLEVRDSGQGIPLHFLPHVFERFTQFDGSSTRAHGGLGLGLAIVRHLVELHGGEVRAESEGPARGARFVVELPLLAEGALAEAPRPAASSRAAAQPSAAVPSLAGVRVLVVEDNEDARDFTVSALTRAGADALGAASSEEGLALLPAHRPNVLLVDLALPSEDGYAFLAKAGALMRATGFSAAAAAMTASVTPEVRARARDAGFELHLPKPCEVRELLAAVARLAAATPSPSCLGEPRGGRKRAAAGDLKAAAASPPATSGAAPRRPSPRPGRRG